MTFKPKDVPLWDVGPCLTYQTTYQAMGDPYEYHKILQQCSGGKGVLNFRTFKVKRKSLVKEKQEPLLTTYQMDYLLLLPDVGPPKPLEYDDTRCNLPLNVFDFPRTNMTKFLDDPLTFPTKERQLVNWTRRRKQHTVLNPELYDPEYDMCCKGRLKELMEFNNLKESRLSGDQNESNKAEGSEDC